MLLVYKVHVVAISSKSMIFKENVRKNIIEHKGFANQYDLYHLYRLFYCDFFCVFVMNY